MFLGPGEFLDEACMGLFVLDEAALVLGQEVDEREQIGIWEDIEDLLDDTLSSCIDDEPVADNGYFHFDISPLGFTLVHDEAVAEGDDAAEDEADGGNEILAWSAGVLGRVGGINDLDILRRHLFLDFVLLALLDEIDIDSLLNLGVALELEIGAHLVRDYAGILLDLLIRAVDLMLSRKISQLFGGIIVVFLGIFNALVEELDEQALGLLTAASLHLEEIVDDFLRDLLGLFWSLSLSGDGDEVRALGILDDEV